MTVPIRLVEFILYPPLGNAGPRGLRLLLRIDRLFEPNLKGMKVKIPSLRPRVFA
jgi:hypothetical protein